MPKRSTSSSELTNESHDAKKQKRQCDAEYSVSTSPMTAKCQTDEAAIPDLTPKESAALKTNTLKIDLTVGNIFKAPPGSVLIHSCNCLGIWGKGIAEAFRKEYPAAFKVYKNHCDRAEKPADLRGTALLIPPCGGTVEKTKGHFIGCLFTSLHHGFRKCNPPKILEATGTSMTELLNQIAEMAKMNEITEIRMPQINSGLFAVPWEDTKNVIQGMTCLDGVPLPVHVFERK